METRLTRTAQFVMYPNWEHWRDLKGTCRDGNPRWRHLGFLVSGQAGNPAEKAWERVRRHPLFHAFSALALIEYQCSPAKAALRVARFGKRIYKVT